MKKSYDSILFHESGESIPLSADEFIEFLLESLYLLRCERDCLERQLDAIQLSLHPKKQDNF